MHMEDKGGRVISPTSSPLLEGVDLWGHAPPALSPLVGRRTWFVLSLSPCFLIEYMTRLLPCRILRRVDLLQFATSSPKTLCKAVSTMKR
jgi:hypothetical protein